MSATIICIWGSPASGKTVCALSLAAQFAEKKKNVIIFSGDKLVPALKLYAPNADISGKQSIGPLLMSGRYDDVALAQRMVVHGESEYISFLGMAPGDTYITYNEFDRTMVIQLANKMAAQADYVIIDGTSNPLDDMMTLTMMEVADVVIRCITADNKGLIYLDAARTVYRDAKFNFDEQITLLGNVKEVSPVSEVMTVSGKYDYILGYSPEVEDKMIAGELIIDMKRGAGISFEKEIKKLVGRIDKFE